MLKNKSSEVQEDFIRQWGINRIIAPIHALIMSTQGEVLDKCETETAKIEGRETEHFSQTMSELKEFVSLRIKLSPKITHLSQSNAIKLALNLLT